MSSEEPRPVFNYQQNYFVTHNMHDIVERQPVTCLTCMLLQPAATSPPFRGQGSGEPLQHFISPSTACLSYYIFISIINHQQEKPLSLRSGRERSGHRG
ncbi:hypothetical protein E2C01_057514 [Portunus trituberculatus]|uniref:Uncharacterized protein n=1 Tax=Portunus trituberculatus TaxID=210409 RepID=A0A5B7H0P1_PORTR|nr:hypothetical protein [Portunus trituberculatus]